MNPSDNVTNVLMVVGICGGGLGRHVRSLSEGLVERGHRVTVVYTPHTVDQAFQRFVDGRRHEIRFVPLKIRREISSASDLRAVVRLVRLIWREGPFDVVHGHSAKGGAIARIVGRLFGMPTVYTPHGLIMSSPKISKAENFIYTLIERILGRLATSRLIAVSEDESELGNKLTLVRKDRIVVIENAVDDEDFDRLAKEPFYGNLDQKPLTFGSTMRFSIQKAPDHLIGAFIRLSSALPQLEMRLVIVGDGELLAQARRQVEASGLAEKIQFLGWRTSVKELLREFDIFVISSLYEAGLSYSSMEAMAAKLPIVSTRVFGAEGTLSKIPGNILVPVGDPGALADSLQRMATLADPGSLREALQRIGQANHDYAREHFRQSETTRRTVEVYRALKR